MFFYCCFSLISHIVTGLALSDIMVGIIIGTVIVTISIVLVVTTLSITIFYCLAVAIGTLVVGTCHYQYK